MNWILAERTECLYDAGPKARLDVAEICTKNGYKKVFLFSRESGKIRRVVELITNLLKLLIKLSDGDKIIIQYPYQPYIMNYIYKILRFHKNIKIILMIHDIFYLWDSSAIKGSKNNILNKEIKIFNRADCLIVHNDKMRHELSKRGVKTNMIKLEIFDYLYKGNPASQTDDLSTIVFAGNISKKKSGFLYNDASKMQLKINLYGLPKYTCSGSNIQYIGSFTSNELIENLCGDFGLVWDGDSVNGCDGIYGNYMRFNNPHKLSMYIAAELPLIVWKEAALASFVENNNLGVVVSSLTELIKILPNIDYKEYNMMKNNVISLSKKIRTGYFLTQVLNKL